MSLYYSIFLEKKDPAPAADEADALMHSSLAAIVTDVCLRHGLPTPDAFLSKLFVEYLDDLSPEPFEDCWFAPDEGLKWVDQVNQSVDYRRMPAETAALLRTSLDAFRQRFERASQIGSRWNLYAM